MQNSNINYIAHNNRNISNSLDQYTRRIQLLLKYTRVLSRTRYNCTIGLYVLHEEDEEGRVRYPKIGNFTNPFY